VHPDDERIVADELAHLDRLAADITPDPAGSRWHDRQRDDEAAYAHLRACGLRRLPVELAAAILREEMLSALQGRHRASISQSEPVWWLGVVARRAGFTDPWSDLFSPLEQRQALHEFRRKRVLAKQKAHREALRAREVASDGQANSQA